ncbi:MAG: hypothetical protein DK305_000263 [Chloroflexi bacterium]|jgi:hypothetical protein|nr:MAG: hypothetical protein DK305_000263 [Chloroflexota bacterium]|tara:strand:- start:2034 stop:2228 length:195 start_codon:yes stop_codon:yes gene_type:complete
MYVKYNPSIKKNIEKKFEITIKLLILIDKSNDKLKAIIVSKMPILGRNALLGLIDFNFLPIRGI